MKTLLPALTALGCMVATAGLARGETTASLHAQFLHPPDAARPGVYWYFLDGNRTQQAMTADLEAMAQSGIGSALFQEVDLGVPRGPVNFMGEAWEDMFVHGVREAERLGLEIILGSGPGWAGSGGPWVKPEESMQHLVASTTQATGPSRFQGRLPVPSPRKPFFNTLTPALVKQRDDYYRDVAVLAFPTPAEAGEIKDADEKALYYRSPYTAGKAVKSFLAPSTPGPAIAADAIIPPGTVLDLTKQLQADGSLDWEVPGGHWTIMRFGARNNGANTRPAPQAGYGFESDKFSATALDGHLAAYAAKLLKKTEPRKAGVGWTAVHIDSWEMGAQNWTPKFREEFMRRRGYDPQPWYPAYTGRVIGNPEMTERFLWDVRQTGQELLIENHAGHFKQFAHDNRMGFSIEPYGMNPTADLEFGGVADIPIGEFWANTHNAAYSCIEAASIAHTMGRPVVGSESFTARDAFVLHPAGIKNQLDWAFATGINRILFHTFQHQPLGDDALPGLMFGPYGINWNRNQTWWPMVDGVHRYITRCSYLLRQGVTVADILYLTPEGAPQVFRAPASALVGDNANLPDRPGYNFDGCAPGTLIARARVRDGRIEFPEGSSYRVLVLPDFETMTLPLLEKIEDLLKQGATVVGNPPHRSPSLSGYPDCDVAIQKKATALWGAETVPPEKSVRAYGKGLLYWGGNLRPGPAPAGEALYPAYEATADLLHELGLPEDFRSDGPIRYTHRQTSTHDIFFVANRSDGEVAAGCSFRTEGHAPMQWDAITGEERPLPDFAQRDGVVTVPLRFAAHQSFFVIFERHANGLSPGASPVHRNFTDLNRAAVLDGPWEISFQPGRGAPDRVTFPALEDWITRLEPGIRYFSGIATYRKDFDLPPGLANPAAAGSLFLDLGTVRDICRVRLNGVDLGVVWTAPWRVNIGAAVKFAENRLEIEVANRWPNRLIGDQQPADAEARTLTWPEGLLGGKSFKTGRYTFVVGKPYKADSPLLSSGLLGPVAIMVGDQNETR